MKLSYNYTTQRDRLFTEEGQRLFEAYRKRVNKVLDEDGFYMSGRVGLPPGIGAADGWDLIACDDRLVELGEVRELTGPEVWAQHRTFARVKRGGG